ncbi:hypothetical protein HMPREF0496_1005 [Lentilactobacillus hilgardii ATCC 27305]|nr:hypothetical protein HMPREF0496_1005 [Lentilactobacillus hilgardii ATCC 27305]
MVNLERYFFAQIGLGYDTFDFQMMSLLIWVIKFLNDNRDRFP